MPHGFLSLYDTNVMVPSRSVVLCYDHAAAAKAFARACPASATNFAPILSALDRFYQYAEVKTQPGFLAHPVRR